MADIITISAAQGQGKSTFIRDIMANSKHANDIDVYKSKTARSVLAEMQVPLEEIFKDAALLKDFQGKVLEKHFDIFSFQVESSKKFVLVERGFIDIAVFSIMNLGRLNEYSDWLDDFVGTCIKNQQSFVKHALYIPMRIIDIKKDAVRPFNMNYNFAYDSVLANYMEFAGVSIGCITQKDRLDRVTQFDTLMDKIHE
jgi:hypothetical protein